jgi:hypothetical protein
VYGGIGGEENVREEVVDVVSLRLLLQGPGEENEDRTKKMSTGSNEVEAIRGDVVVRVCTI